MAKTFTWRVERDVDSTIEMRVIETQFGDGYKQTLADGINTVNESYAIKVHALEPEARQIMAFFKEHAGWKSFFWTPPLGDLGLYTCIDPKPTNIGGKLYTITGTFVKSFSTKN
ncbi:MAG: minor tail protein [Caudoviricetes sp.]|nr:MAG: minor tail protein [Caudoviricetes sp.]